MKGLVAIFAFLFVGYGQSTDNTDNELKDIIVRCIDYSDTNPIHKEEIDGLREEFKYRMKSYPSDMKDYESSYRDWLFNILYDYAKNVYEDSPDYRRMKMKRAFCFLLLAITSDSDRALTFLEYAKLSVQEFIDNPDYEMLERQLLGVYWLEVFLRKQSNRLTIENIDNLEQYIDHNRTMLDIDVVRDSEKLIETLKESISGNQKIDTGIYSDTNRSCLNFVFV